MVYVEGVKAGFQVVHTASGPLSRGTSQPEVGSTVRNLECERYATHLDLEARGARGRALRSAWPGPRAYRRARPASSTRPTTATSCRAGWSRTTRRMLEEHRAARSSSRRCSRRSSRVRAEMGYPILVTPVSQFVASQAARNVIDPERWANVSDETVRYFLGHYGEPAAPVDPEVAEKVLSRPQAAKLRHLTPISLEGARERFGQRISEEELLLRLTMPGEQVDAMIEARGKPAPAPAPRPRPGRSPLVSLLERAGQPPARISQFDADAGRRQGGVAACLSGLLRDVRGFVFDVDGTLAHRGPDGRARPQPGAVEVLERIRASGRPLARVHQRQPRDARRRWPARCARTASRCTTTRC